MADCAYCRWWNDKDKSLWAAIDDHQREREDHLKDRCENEQVCDCQNADPKEGIALVSNECPIHNP